MFIFLLDFQLYFENIVTVQERNEKNVCYGYKNLKLSAGF